MKMSEDPSILGVHQATVFVGALLADTGRYWLVQEAKAGCRGLWNIPGGHLQPNESISDGATREVYEETGHLVELTGVCPLVNCVTSHGTMILVPFTASIIGTNIAHRTEEILQTRQFTRAEIEAMSDQLRFPELIIDLLQHFEAGEIYPLSAIRVYQT